jgi:23S rRNA pseudouridine1911/1915/1917 synthase
MEIKLSSPSTGGFWEIPILHEDEHLLVVNKPVGLLISPDKAAPDRPNLIDLLHRGIAEAKPWAAARSLSFLMYAHRLDTEASGILLLAKSKLVLTKLLDLFGSEKPTLLFVVLAGGSPADERFTVEAKLAPHPAKPGLMHVNPKTGKRARTAFEIIERFRGWTLLRCVPLTNRAHQIRVHLGRAGLRVAGDEIYGGKPLWLSSLKPNYHLKPKHTERPLIGSACLHAEQLAIEHPVTGAALRIQAPWPKDLQVALKYLRKYSPA